MTGIAINLTFEDLDQYEIQGHPNRGAECARERIEWRCYWDQDKPGLVCQQGHWRRQTRKVFLSFLVSSFLLCDRNSGFQRFQILMCLSTLLVVEAIDSDKHARYEQLIAFGVSFLHYQNLINHQILYVTFAMFHWKETNYIEIRKWHPMTLQMQ